MCLHHVAHIVTEFASKVGIMGVDRDLRPGLWLTVRHDLSETNSHLAVQIFGIKWERGI